MLRNEEIVKGHRDRAYLILKFIVFCFVIIIARLFYLQILKGELLYKFSLKNRLRREIVKSPRGMIFDRKNSLIVNNIPQFDAVVIPQYLKKKEGTLKRLAEILGMSMEDVNKVLIKKGSGARYRPVIIKKNISRVEVALIETENMDIPGVAVEMVIGRIYREGKIFAHVLGHVAEVNQDDIDNVAENKMQQHDYKLGDYIGRNGVEQSFNKHLRGQDGLEFMEVDASGRKRRYINTDNFFKGIENIATTPGNNLELTIDFDLQKAAYDALEGKVGGVVALDIETGEVLTMVSRPSFDPSLFSRTLSQDYWNSLIQNKDNPLINKAIQEHYSPGSTFKVITAITGLEEGLINKNTEVTCQGKFQLGRRTYHCWKKYGHGKVKLKKAIRESCNVYFYKLASRMDINVLAKYARMFGLGSRTGIDLPREIPGLIPSREWKKNVFGKDWVLGETLSCAIGQSHILATPLQMANLYAIIANKGRVYRPTIVKKISRTDGKVIKEYVPEELKRLDISEETFQLVGNGLFEVANRSGGTAFFRRALGIQMAGKTGTSQVIQLSADKIYQKCEDMPYDFRNHGVFVAFAPYDNPKIAISVFIEHGCHGSSAGIPVANAIFKAYMQKYLPDLYKKNYEIERKKRAQLYMNWKLEQEKKKKESSE